MSDTQAPEAQAAESTVGDVLKKDGVQIVQVRFSGANNKVYDSKPYAYYTDLDLKEGDHVVVDVRGEAPYAGLKVVKVASTEETVNGILNAHSWVICKVDTEAHQKRLEREERRAIIEAKLIKAAEIAHRNQFLSTLAAHNPEISSLLVELKALEQ